VAGLNGARRLPLAGVVLALTLGCPVGSAAQSSVRVHHLHVLVDDPIAAMRARAETLGGVVVPLAGVGAGVRIDGHYLLFERDPRPRSEPRTSDPLQGAVDASVRWLVEHAVSVDAAGLAPLLRASAGEASPIDHVGFATADYAAVVDLIAAQGARPLSRTDNAAMFALPGGVRIEIVRDAEGPDAYWCPMHPGVRSTATGRCPLCSMELVEIGAARIGEYRMDVSALPGAQGRGLGGLRLALVDPENGKPVSDLLTVHEKRLHLFIISRDLEYFAHVHPVAAGNGTFVVTHQAPPGDYVIIADFLPKNGTSQMVHRALVTPRLRRRAAPTTAILQTDIPGASQGHATWGAAEKTVDGVRVRLDAADLTAGRIGLLRFHLFDAADGTPIEDLEPYLGAAGHMLMTTATLTDAIHGHPEEMGTRTPVITFKPLMPPPGVAKLWVQFQRHGQIITVPFVIEVLDP
jgi:hypothetical protein